MTLLYASRRGFPFTAYGETALIAVQNLVVCVLVLMYGYGGKGGKATAGVFVAGVVGAVTVVGDERWVDMRRLGWLQAGAGAVGVASKGPQIWVNWREGGTGVLSAFTVCFFFFFFLLLFGGTWMSVMVGWGYRRHDKTDTEFPSFPQVFTYLAGSLSRIFTTLQEVDDKLILYGFIAGFALNAVLAAQMVYYWRSSSVATAERGEEAYSEKPKKEEIAVGSSTGASTKGKGPSTRRRG